MQATSSWTLPSHASFFTGRWPHELSASWFTPLDASHPTLAEYLGSRGYATAGFVANTSYCGADTGLGRGFAIYQDYFFPELSAFKMAALINRPLEGLRSLDRFLREHLKVDRVATLREANLGAIQRRCAERRTGGPSRVARLAVESPSARAAVLRLRELLRCPLSL